MALPPPPPSAPPAPPAPPGEFVDDAARPAIDSPRSGESWRRWIVFALVAALLGGIAGAVWASSQSAEYRSVGRASFVDRVDIGAVDAERARLLSELGDDLERTVVAISPGAAVATETPSGRNFIDVVVVAGTPDGLDDAALAGAQAIVDVEAADLVARLTLEAAAQREAADGLEPDVTALEAEMAEHLADEAAADVLRSDDDAAVREQAFIDARNANDAYWKAARKRNALVDQQNEFVRAAERLDTEAAAASSLEVSSVTPAEPDSTPSVPLGAAGGAALGLAVVALGAAAFGPRRS